jgi:hypothetical protein
MLSRFLAAVAVAVSLAGCMSPIRMDDQIAQTSAKLAQQCGTVAALIQTAAQFSAKPKVQRALMAAESARAAFCAAPPTDTTTAVLTLGSVILTVQAALKA